MNQGGRPVDSVWQYFMKIEEGGKVSKAKCINCGLSISAEACRLRYHIEKCSTEKSQATNSLLFSPELEVISDDPDIQAGKRIRCTMQPKMNYYVVKTNLQQKDDLDAQIARLFFACNLPFNLVEHDVFKQTIAMLRPGYAPPTRKKLAGPLLDQIYNEVTEAAASVLKGKNVTLVQDGWSDIHNSPVIAHSVHTEEKSYFVNSVDTGTNRKTATYWASLAIEATEEATVKFRCKVVAIVTDNERKKKDNSLTVYGCASHILNLLAKDITPSQVINQITEINKYFRNHHVPGSLLSNQIGSVKPQLPVVTRWNSQMEYIRTYLINRPFFLMILAQHEDVIETSIANLISNIGLYREARHFQAKIQPIATSLNKLQNDESNIADTCEEWNKLLEIEELDCHKYKIQERYKQAVTPIHLLANMLHPKYMGQRLTCEQQEVARNILIEQNPSLLPQLYQYQAKAEPFPTSIFACTDSLKPTTWWKTVKSSKNMVSNELRDIAIKLLSLPSSSASIERIFSNFGIIQTKLRNRLGIEKAARLVSCYRELRGKQDELDW